MVVVVVVVNILFSRLCASSLFVGWIVFCCFLFSKCLVLSFLCIYPLSPCPINLICTCVFGSALLQEIEGARYHRQVVAFDEWFSLLWDLPDGYGL